MKKETKSADTHRIRPALTPESRENQMIALAVDLAEKQMLEGTASSQVITHFLKLGSTKAALEKTKLEYETKMIEAKTESLRAAQHSSELYEEAIEAMRRYSGQGDQSDDY